MDILHQTIPTTQTHVFMKDLQPPPAPGPRTPAGALDGEQYQAITFMTERTNEHLLLDRAPHLKPPGGHPTFPGCIPATGGKDKGTWTPCSPTSA